MTGARLAVPALFFWATLAAPGEGLAQAYRWVDERGTIHYSEGLDSVPERFRSKAEALSLKPAPAPAPEPFKPAAAPSGVTKIPFKPGSPILVSAKISGKGPVTLMLDTGADRTLIAPLALWRMGISTWFAPRGEIRGATGTTRAELVRVESIEIGEAKVGSMVIIAHDVELPGMDGLLGRDFLNRFDVTIDTTAGVVTLSPR